MASSSESFRQRVERHVRAPGFEPLDLSGNLPAPSLARFIPREELGPVARWMPGRLDSRGVPVPEPAPPPPPDPKAEQAAREAEQARAAQEALLRRVADEAFERGRQQGHQEGVQVGRAEANELMARFREQYLSDAGVPVARVLEQFQHQLDLLEQAMARRVAGIALQVARQVVRTELHTPAAVVIAVTQEALDDVLLSARHITVRLHPADLLLVEQGCAEVFTARGVRVLPDSQVERGGCLVESDLGAVDARIGTRWARAVAALGPVPAGDASAAPDALAAS